jgi:6,7-dimethyl-8-ribityllumazine synthase
VIRIALVVSSYHAFVTDKLEAGARAALREAQADLDVETFVVPGAYELAQAAHRLAETEAWSAIVCLGCLIKGETPHFDYIARATADGIMRAAQDTGVPITFGVLTTHTAEEALARAGEGPANKGREAALAALALATLYDRIDDLSDAVRPGDAD